MLVPSMSIDELRIEMGKDMLILMRKSDYVAHKLMRAHMPLKDKHIVRFYDYYSKYKNNWIYRIEMTKKITLFSYMAYFETPKGINAMYMLQPQLALCYFTSHVFNRYNERTKLNLVKPIEIMQSFMNNNGQMQAETLEETSAKIAKVFVVSDSGVLLGWYDGEKKFYKFNTFITHEMLKGDQLEREAELKLQLEKYKGNRGRLD